MYLDAPRTRNPEPYSALLAQPRTRDTPPTHTPQSSSSSTSHNKQYISASARYRFPPPTDLDLMPTNTEPRHGNEIAGERKGTRTNETMR